MILLCSSLVFRPYARKVSRDQSVEYNLSETGKISQLLLPAEVVLVYSRKPQEEPFSQRTCSSQTARLATLSTGPHIDTNGLRAVDYIRWSWGPQGSDTTSHNHICNSQKTLLSIPSPKYLIDILCTEQTWQQASKLVRMANLTNVTQTIMFSNNDN